MHIHIYAIVCFGAGAVALALACFALKRREVLARKYFALTMLSVAIYSFCYALEISSKSLSSVLFFHRLEYVGIVFLPAFYALFAMGFTGKPNWLTRPVVSAILVLPAITLLLVFTNNIHHFFLRQPRINPGGPFPVLTFEPAVWYWVHQAYAISAIVFGGFLFLRMYMRTTPAFRGQLAMILVGGLAPFLSYLLYLTGMVPWGIDPTPFAFTFSGGMVFLGLMRYRLFDLVPVAREWLLERLPDAVLVLDRKHRIVDCNQSACRYLGISKKDIGKPASTVLRSWPELVGAMEAPGIKHSMEIQTDMDGGPLWFHADFSLLHAQDGLLKGQLGILRDVTAHRQYEQSLRESLHEKELLLREIHHRVKNNLQIISSLLRLQFSKASHPELLELMRDSQSRIEAIALVHDTLYRSEALSDIRLLEYAQALAAGVKRAHGRAANIRVQVDVRPVQLVMHPDKAIPLGLVLNELLTNALKHAFPEGQDGTVRIEADVMAGNALEITFTDDGVGLPENLDVRRSDTLGLDLVSGLVEMQLDGSLTWQNKDGATFIIRFPI